MRAFVVLTAILGFLGSCKLDKISPFGGKKIVPPIEKCLAGRLAKNSTSVTAFIPSLCSIV